MKFSKEIFILHFFCSLFMLLAMVNQPGSNGEPIELKYADSLVGTKTEAGKVREFVGNVRFQQGNVITTSDRAFQYLDQNNAELIGNVVITQEDMVLKSPRIFYNGNDKTAASNSGLVIKDKNGNLTARRGVYSMRTYIADFNDSVRVFDDTVTITADRIVYNRKTRVSDAYNNVVVEDDSVMIISDTARHLRLTRESYAWGNVFVRGKYQDVLLSCDSLAFSNVRKHTKAFGNPVLNQVDTIGTISDTSYLDTNKLDVIVEQNLDSLTAPKLDTLSVRSDTMESYRGNGSDIYYFISHVELHRGNVSAKAGFAVYNKLKEIITLEDVPVVWYDSTQLHSDSIVIFTPEKKLEKIHAFRNALAATRDDTLDLQRINQIIGDEIIINISRDTIRSLVSYGNAKSLYFLVSDSSEDGASRYGSDTIHVEFLKGEAENINWLGAIQGEFFPENLVWEKPKEYYLPGFRWSDNKPQKQYVKFRQKK